MFVKTLTILFSAFISAFFISCGNEDDTEKECYFSPIIKNNEFEFGG